MIALTLAEVAELVGRRAHRSRRRRRDRRGHPRLPRGVRGRPVRRAWRGSGSTATTSSRAAAAAGAVAALCSRPDDALPCVVVPDPVAALGRLAAGVHARLTAGGLRTLAITGSSGKTSTKDLLGQVLAAAGPTVSPPGSYNNDIGLPLTVLDADETTRYLVLEMGSRGPGHIARLCGVARPQIGVVLNVGSAHLGEFGSPEGIAQAKGELVESLPDDGTAVLNADDPRVLGMAARTRARVLTTGLGDDADVRATGVTLDGVRPRPLHPRRGGGGAPGRAAGGRGSTRWPTPSRPPAPRWPPASPRPTIAAALSSAGSRSRWRMEVERRADGVTVVNDAYNANPESMRAALAALAGLAGERRIAVLGAMAELGPDAAAEHERLGRDAVAAGVDLVVAVGPDAVGIADGASAAGGRAGEESVHVPDRAAARELLSDLLRPGDVVLVKASRSYGLELLAADLLDPGAAA